MKQLEQSDLHQDSNGEITPPSTEFEPTTLQAQVHNLTVTSGEVKSELLEKAPKVWPTCA